MKAIKRTGIRRWPQRPAVGKRAGVQSRKEMALLGFRGRAQATAGLPEALPEPSLPPASREAESRLGQPIGIAAISSLIGCSPWTVRQTLIPQGLPVFRSAASGKLIFYTNQVVRWIERRQQKGGN
ncbi:MAG TPA: hypothetical protein VHU83_11535 [Bryobacteraceae bacterium]|jgi:hypothetical protein|nr:hypothetical protein [Bryobacteraceae bacterium]